ncbi:MAG TPA: iron-sulfur cluster assembly scaffold protein [Terriglobales bacterium]
MYSPQLLDHFQNPRHAGDLPDATACIRLENPVCGDIIELSAVATHDRLADIRFRAKGCVPVMACASALCELAHSKPVSVVREISKKDVLLAVGGVPPASDHAAQLAMDALTALLKQLGIPNPSSQGRGWGR